MNKLHTRSTEDLERTADYIAELQAEIDRLTQALSRAGYANSRLREALAAITAQFEKVDHLYSRDRDIIAQAREALK